MDGSRSEVHKRVLLLKWPIALHPHLLAGQLPGTYAGTPGKSNRCLYEEGRVLLHMPRPLLWEETLSSACSYLRRKGGGALDALPYFVTREMISTRQDFGQSISEQFRRAIYHLDVPQAQVQCQSRLPKLCPAGCLVITRDVVCQMAV